MDKIVELVDKLVSDYGPITLATRAALLEAIEEYVVDEIHGAYREGYAVGKEDGVESGFSHCSS